MLGTLYGQAVTDLMSGLSYGPKAKEAIDKAVEKAPKVDGMYVARGVGNYYLPAQWVAAPRGRSPISGRRSSSIRKTPRPICGWA